MNKIFLTTAIVGLFLSSCTRTNDFKPTAEMTGKDIFNAACVECHAAEGDSVMVLNAEMNDVDRIANHVLTGSISMPAFPNIQGESAKILAEYVVENSTFK